MKFHVILSHFDAKIGPTVFYSYPDHILNEKGAAKIANMMDYIESEGFFTYNYGNFFSLNYSFELVSTWGRGDREWLMISTIFNKRPLDKIEKVILPLFIEFSEWLKSKDEIFTAFYKNSLKYNKYKECKEKIDENCLSVQSWIIEFYNAIIEEIQEKTEKENLNSLLDREDVLLTLKLISDGPKPIAHLKNWYNIKYPELNFYKLLLKLVKNQMIYIPKFGEKKKPPFELYVSDDIKTIANILILKTRLLNSFLEKRQASELKSMQINSKSLRKQLEKTLPETRSP